MAKKSSKKPMFWICGNYYDSRKFWKQIIEKVSDPNIENIDCGTNLDKSISQASNIILLLKSRDMFDSKPRIIRLRGLPADYAIIADYLKYVNDENILVIDSPVGYHDGRKFVSASASNFYKTICSDGYLLDAGTDAKSDSDAISWVTQVFQDHNKTIDRDTAQLLVSMKGKNFDSLLVEINKLIAYQTKKNITIEDVTTCSIPVYTQTAWNLIDQLDLCQLDESLSNLQKFYEHAGSQTGKSFRGDVEMLMGALHYHFLFLLFAKDSCGDDFNYDRLVKGVEGYKKEIDNKRENDYFGKPAVMMATRSEVFKKAVRKSKPQTYLNYLAVCRCLSKIRVSNNEEVIKTCLDAMCMFVCNKVTEVQMLGLMGIQK